MAFNKDAWEPSAGQLALSGFALAWVAAALVENLVLHETDINVCLSGCVKGILTLRWYVLINPILSWGVIPFLVLYIPIRLIRPIRLYLLFAGTIGLAVLLVVWDLKAPPFPGF